MNDRTSANGNNVHRSNLIQPGTGPAPEDERDFIDPVRDDDFPEHRGDILFDDDAGFNSDALIDGGMPDDSGDTMEAPTEEPDITPPHLDNPGGGATGSGGNGSGNSPGNGGTGAWGDGGNGGSSGNGGTGNGTAPGNENEMAPGTRPDSRPGGESGASPNHDHSDMSNTEPNTNCDSPQIANPKVRFLHAAVDYGTFKVAVASTVIDDELAYGHFTEYRENFIEAGYRTVTVTLNDDLNTVVYRSAFAFMDGDVVTLAITETEFGIYVAYIQENMTCPSKDAASVRFVNLCSDSPPLDMILLDRRVIFNHVPYKVITPYRRFHEGHYDFFLAYEPEPNGSYLLCELVKSSYIDVKVGHIYTLYILGLVKRPDTIRILTSEFSDET